MIAGVIENTDFVLQLHHEDGVLRVGLFQVPHQRSERVRVCVATRPAKRG